MPVWNWHFWKAGIIYLKTINQFSFSIQKLWKRSHTIETPWRIPINWKLLIGNYYKQVFFSHCLNQILILSLAIHEMSLKIWACVMCRKIWVFSFSTAKYGCYSRTIAPISRTFLIPIKYLYHTLILLLTRSFIKCDGKCGFITFQQQQNDYNLGTTAPISRKF